MCHGGKRAKIAAWRIHKLRTARLRKGRLGLHGLGCLRVRYHRLLHGWLRRWLACELRAHHLRSHLPE